jgi:putative chitinase
MRTSAQWIEILTGCGVKPATAAAWSDAFASEVLESNFSLGAAEIDDFIATCLHESAMLEKMEESLNYSTEALISKFGRHRISIEDAQAYGRNAAHPADQPRIANCLYGGKWGRDNLGNTESGDGWAYRGSGVGGLTGRANFRLVEKATGLPLEANPDLVRRPGPEALQVFIAWWEKRVPDSVIGDVPMTRRKVNGGDFGLAHVAELTEQLQDKLA